METAKIRKEVKPTPTLVVDSVFENANETRYNIGKLGPFAAIGASGVRSTLSPAQAAIITPLSLRQKDGASQHLFRLDSQEALGRSVDPFEYLGIAAFVRSRIAKAFPHSRLGPAIEHSVNVFLPSRSELAIHTDVPHFYGLDDAPRWLRLLMLRSGLFSKWHIKLATCLCWLYEGIGGDFVYWPDGPTSSPSNIAPIHNKMLICDTDQVFHGVRSTGNSTVDLPLGKMLGSTLHVGDDQNAEWAIKRQGFEPLRFAASALRVTVIARYPVAEAEVPPPKVLDVEAVISTFIDDLDKRGVDTSEIESLDRLCAILNEIYPAMVPLT